MCVHGKCYHSNGIKPSNRFDTRIPYCVFDFESHKHIGLCGIDKVAIAVKSSFIRLLVLLLCHLFDWICPFLPLSLYRNGHLFHLRIILITCFCLLCSTNFYSSLHSTSFIIIISIYVGWFSFCFSFSFFLSLVYRFWFNAVELIIGILVGSVCYFFFRRTIRK